MKGSMKCAQASLWHGRVMCEHRATIKPLSVPPAATDWDPLWPLELMS